LFGVQQAGDFNTEGEGACAPLALCATSFIIAKSGGTIRAKGHLLPLVFARCHVLSFPVWFANLSRKI